MKGVTPMEGLGMSIAALATSMAQQNTATAVSMKMMKNVMETNEAAGAQLVESLNQMTELLPNGVGSLLDIRA